MTEMNRDKLEGRERMSADRTGRYTGRKGRDKTMRKIRKTRQLGIGREKIPPV